tara:strand:+ start:157174 stop:157581 length:408 start_codon:yes stop_codon:yes gene_type:complete
MFKVIVAGGRDFNDFPYMVEQLDKLLKNKDNVQIISGTAPGADILGESYARTRGLAIKRFPAPWEDIEGRPEKEIGTTRGGKKYWKGAGHFRNEQMAEYGDALVAFWDGKSGGTKNMIATAKRHKLLVRKKLYQL